MVLESPSPKDALCQVLSKLVLEKKIFKFRQCIFCNFVIISFCKLIWMDHVRRHSGQWRLSIVATEVATSSVQKVLPVHSNGFEDLYETRSLLSLSLSLSPIVYCIYLFIYYLFYPKVLPVHSTCFELSLPLSLLLFLSVCKKEIKYIFYDCKVSLIHEDIHELQYMYKDICKQNVIPKSTT